MSSRRRQLIQRPRLRVAFIMPGLGMGGAERWAMTLARHFSENIEVMGFFVGDEHGALRSEAARCAPVYNVSVFAQIGSMVDVVIAWGWPKLPETLRGYCGRVIAVSHGLRDLAWSRLCAEAMATTPNVELAAVSDGAAATWPQGPRCTVIRNGAELDRCSPTMTRDEALAHYGLPKDKQLLLSFGRFSPEKRLDILSQTTALLSDDWHLVLVGGPAAALPDLGLNLPPDKVTILPPQPRPGDLLALASLFIMLSETEAHPLALTEAWLAGTPTLWCAWPLANELLLEFYEEPLFGVIIPVETKPPQIAHLIPMASRLRLDGKWISADSSRATQQWAWRHCTAATMASNWEDFLFHRKPQT